MMKNKLVIDKAKVCLLALPINIGLNFAFLHIAFPEPNFFVDGLIMIVIQTAIFFSYLISIFFIIGLLFYMKSEKNILFCFS